MQNVVIFSGPCWAPGPGVFAFVQLQLTDAFLKEFPSAQWDPYMTARLLPHKDGIEVLLWKSLADPERPVEVISTAQLKRLLTTGTI